MVAKSIAKMYTNIHKPTDYRGIGRVFIGQRRTFLINPLEQCELNVTTTNSMTARMIVISRQCSTSDDLQICVIRNRVRSRDTFR